MIAGWGGTFVCTRWDFAKKIHFQIRQHRIFNRVFYMIFRRHIFFREIVELDFEKFDIFHFVNRWNVLFLVFTKSAEWLFFQEPATLILVSYDFPGCCYVISKKLEKTFFFGWSQKMTSENAPIFLAFFEIYYFIDVIVIFLFTFTVSLSVSELFSIW